MFTKDYGDREVYVDGDLVGFTEKGSHPSDTKYYRSERGYDCGNDDECVADRYYENFGKEGEATW